MSSPALTDVWPVTTSTNLHSLLVVCPPVEHFWKHTSPGQKARRWAERQKHNKPTITHPDLTLRYTATNLSAVSNISPDSLLGPSLSVQWSSQLWQGMQCTEVFSCTNVPFFLPREHTLLPVLCLSAAQRIQSPSVNQIVIVSIKNTHFLSTQLKIHNLCINPASFFGGSRPGSNILRRFGG